MKPKAHILVVEDKSIIYKRLKIFLKDNYYSVDKYTPSVEVALAHINKERPDLVLLDINLQGEYNGIYLGHLLKTAYNIPFIYVTELDDDQTFYESLKTKQDDFISKKDIHLTEEEPLVIQTKPHLDEKRLLRSIQTVLELHKIEPTPIIKERLMGYVDLPKNIKDFGSNEVSQRPVLIDNIEYLTSKIIEINSDSISKEKIEQLKKEGRNIAKILTIDNEVFYYRGNLSKIIETLPYNFVRINESEIINLTVSSIDGRINGRRIKIKNKIFTISDTYKEEVEKRIAHFY